MRKGIAHLFLVVQIAVFFNDKNLLGMNCVHFFFWGGGGCSRRMEKKIN